jgi:hypothetical protein
MMLAQFGRVLLAMSEYARKRAETRRHYLGQQNVELLMAISFTLQTGVDKCVEIADERD